MSERDDKLLDENLSRLLSDGTKTPQLSADAEAEMLNHLRSKQAELFSTEEKAMNPATNLANRPEQLTNVQRWAIPLTGLAVLATFVIVSVVFNSGSTDNDGTDSGGVVDGGVVDKVKSFQSNEVSRDQLEDGTVLFARKGAKYAIEGRRRVRLESGDLYLIVAKSEEPFLVITKDGEVRAVGTRFTVSVANQTTAAVAQGRVTLAGNKGKVALQAGQQGTLRKGEQPTRKPAPRLSFLVNWAKEALAQEELLVEKKEAQEGLIAIDPWGQETKLTLRKYQVDVYIEDGIARTTIDQTFFNHYPWNTEGTFYFPLPPDASVSRLAMYVAGQLNEGGMVEREYGQQVYNEILHQRRDPALLEMMEGNVFKMRIFPLEGRQEKRVFLSYTQKLEELYGTMRYWFPMDHTHSVAKQVSIRVHVKDGAKHYDPQSSTHDLDVARDGDDLVLKYDAEKIKPDQDLLLHLIPAKKAEAVRIATCEKDGAKFVFGRFTADLPGEVAAKPRQWIVLNDISASRSKVEAEAQRYILGRLLQEADDDDSVYLLDLNTRATAITDKPLPVRCDAALALPQHRPEAHVGATNMSAGIEAAKQAIKKHQAKNPHILYLGDGVATDGKTEVFSLVRALPKGATFVGVGVGKKVDSLFLQSAADQTGGMFTTINPDEDIDWRVFDFVAALNTPRLTKIRTSLLDARGNKLDATSAIAYPSTRSLADGELLTVVARCEKELPAKVVFEGKVGGKTTKFEAALDAKVKVDAEFIPRLWAKRHIDELTKSDMERKDEIVALSKQYYVVTPFTSLIVLEDDAMYEQYKVERGRKDHWALYPAPREIEVIKEPVDWSEWGWWGGGVGEDAKVEASARPQSVQEIVDSVQFRLNAPFYFWQPQARQHGQGRFALYQLLDSESDPTRLLTYWFLLAAGQEIPSLPGDKATAAEASGGSPDPTEGESGQKAIYMGHRFLLLDDFSTPTVQLNLPASRRGTSLGYDFDGRFRQGGGRGFGASGRGLGFYYQPLGVSLSGNDWADGFGDARADMLFSAGGKRISLPRVVAATPAPAGQIMAGERFSWRMDSYAYGFSVSGKDPGTITQLGTMPDSAVVSDLASLDILPPKLSKSLDESLRQRWTRINRDVRDFNRQYGYWGDFGLWNEQSIDLGESRAARWQGGLDEFLGDDDDNGVVQFQSFLKSDRQLSAASLLGPSEKSIEQPVIGWVSVYRQSLKSQPGTCSVMAASYLASRQEQLLKEDSPESERELKLVQHALTHLETAVGRLEESGSFWGHQGWSYQPRAWAFQAPTVQAYSNYNWSFDLTRYAPGLYSNSFDIVNEVASQMSPESAASKTGKISDALRQRLTKISANVPAANIRYVKDGVAITVAGGDRFEMTRRTDMYLEERTVCDGEQILHVYQELGLAARRPATELRLAALRRLVPHLVTSVDGLLSRYDIELISETDDRLTLRLSPIGQAEDDKNKFEVKLVLGTDGRIHSKTLFANKETLVRLAFAYTDTEVHARWFDKDDKQQSELKYFAAILPGSSQQFETKADDLVVFEMPLRKPSYYQKHLAELGNSPAVSDLEKRISWNRHRALALLQELNWRRWGGQNDEVRKALNESFKIMTKLGQKAKLGDLTLLGSGGVFHSLDTIPVAKTFDATHPVARFFHQRQRGWQQADKLAEDHPETLVGHLAAYQAAVRHNTITDHYKRFIAKYDSSPLLLASAYFCSQWGNQPEGWFELLDQPRWRELALFIAAPMMKTAEHQQEFVKHFKKTDDELSEAGYEIPLTTQMVAIVKEVDIKLWQSILDRRWQAVQKQEDVAPVLYFAEQTMSWDETELADKVLQLARERLDGGDELLSRFALAQTLWTGSRYRPALDLYDKIFAELKEKKVTPSSALLASVARLAQQAGDPARAIELEEQALAKEHEHLPDLINLQAFRQRYQWLWQQYQAKVSSADLSQKEKDAWLSRAEATWRRWYEVDPRNMEMIKQMASLQITAGHEDEAWLYLSTAIDQRPKDAISYYTVGQWYHGRKQLGETEKWYGRAYEWDTANPRWLLERAQVLMQIDRKPEAREVYQKIVDGKWAPGLQNYVQQARQALQ